MVSIVTNTSGATWWPNLKSIQVAPTCACGQICNYCKWCHLVAKCVTKAISMQVVLSGDQIWNKCICFRANCETLPERIQVIESVTWVIFRSTTDPATQIRCKFGHKVVKLAWLQQVAKFAILKWDNSSRSRSQFLGQLCLWQCFCWAIKMAFTCGLASQVNLFKRPFSATFKAVQADMPEVVCCKANFGKQGFWKCLKCAPYCNKAQVYPLTPVPC